jgi:D-alanyl-D-alanine-carboxypeptidase/D-alanyl-D-alanine-endopeptidase
MFAGASVMCTCEKQEEKIPDFSNVHEVADYYLEKAVSDKVIIGASAGIIQNDNEQDFYYGSKRKDSDELPDYNTMFEIGSITKTFTALLLAKDCLEGTLQLNDAVNDYLPDDVHIKDYNNLPLTFFHTVTHTGGFPHDPENLQNYEVSPEEPYEGYTFDAFYTWLNSFQPEWAYGSRYVYSNVGFALTGHILSLIHSENYADLVKLEIFDKLSMQHSYVSSDETIDHFDNLATGYSSGSGIPEFKMPDFYAGAGAIESSIGDMIIYLRLQMGLDNTSLNNAASYCHDQTIPFGNGVYSGLAWGINDTPKGKIYFHDGGTPGQTSYIIFNKEQKNGVVLLTNTHNDQTTAIAQKIFFWMQYHPLQVK